MGVFVGTSSYGVAALGPSVFAPASPRCPCDLCPGPIPTRRLGRRGAFGPALQRVPLQSRVGARPKTLAWCAPYRGS